MLMAKINDGGSAFPIVAPDSAGECGMSLLDWFAAHAPEPPRAWWDDGHPYCSGYAMWNYQYARAMLAERERQP